MESASKSMTGRRRRPSNTPDISSPDVESIASPLSRSAGSQGSMTPTPTSASGPTHTIRTVTPESSIAEEDTDDGQEDIPTTSPPTSPRPTQRDSFVRNTPRPLAHRAGSSEAEYNRRTVIVDSTQSRPRTRTMEERPRDRDRDGSPSTLYIKSRHRIGSVHSASPTQYQTLEEAVSPLSHPIPMSPPPTSSRRSNTMNRPRAVKSNSSRNTSPLPYGAAPAESLSTPFAAPNARKILQLMKTCCGRMQGQLAFRRGGGTMWSLYYCYVDDDSGALIYEPKQESSHKTLIPDLRGCSTKTAFDQENYTPYLEVASPNSSLEVHLRPPTQDEFDQWHAALLCWQPIRPKGIHNRMAKPQQPLSTDRRLQDSRRHSEVSLLKEAPIIKVGKMIFWDTNVSYGNTPLPKSSRPAAYRMQSFGSRRWRRVSCTLRENGELKLYSEADVTLVSVIQLSHLSRSAIQRLDPSVLDNEFCIAIYPQYTATSSSMFLLRPIFLSLESRVQYEVWVVLLRAFTIPQLYGPKQSSSTEDLSSSSSNVTNTQDLFRMERALSVRVIEARTAQSPGHRPPEPSRHGSSNQNGGYFVDVSLDGEIRARTMTKGEGSNPFWREDFDFIDLPPIMSTASLTLKRRPPQPGASDKSPREETKAIQDALQQHPDAASTRGGVSFDQTLGKVDLYLDDLEPSQAVEKWWPLINMHGHSIGEILVRVQAEESVILMARDYQPLSELLHRFTNGVTAQVSQLLPGYLKEVSECFLNIFQVSGQAGDWIMSLIEDEVDETMKDSPMTRLRFSARVGSNESEFSESFASNSQREVFVRDMNTNAKLEANLLFRGNTLLTKAVDHHMKRLGKEYLEETLADKMKEINDRDIDCEVDPHRIRFQHDLERNWRKLLNITEEVWKCIYNSSQRCPTDLRMIFRHVRSCAEGRYGDFLRSVSYSSVSGFLFLRFFCAAVLNPKLFGLLRDHPRQRARRTLTLIAKSLQGLANMSTFGSKEAWMEPMNQFLNSHRQEFKTFIDNICDVSAEDRSLSSLPPSYSTPLAILQRLPPTSREGFPSLPYLIDHAKNFADLVNLWLDNINPNTAELIEDPTCPEGQSELAKFHVICISLRTRTRECLERAERAERPDSSLSMKWEELVEQLEQSSLIDPVSTVPSTHPQVHHQVQRHRAAGTASSSASTAGPYSPNSDVPPEETPPGSASGQAVAFGSSISSAPPIPGDGSRSADGSTNYGHFGSNVSSDAEYTTALPRVERAEKEKEKEKKKLGGLVGGFKKRREKMIEREREREKEMFRSGFPRRDAPGGGDGSGSVNSSQGWLSTNGGVF